MAVILYAMFGTLLLVIIFAVVFFVKQKKVFTNSGAQSYEVFAVSGGQLTVLAGIPVAYQIDEIMEVTFSSMKAVRSISVYNGIMRVVKKNGKKSRPFMFNSSVYLKKTVLVSSKQEIEKAIEYLMNELRQHHIPCSHVA